MILNYGVRLLFVLMLFDLKPLFSSGLEKNKWFGIKVKTDPLKTKHFEAFLTVPQNADSLRALYVAVPNGNVWFSEDGYGKSWKETSGLEQKKVRSLMLHSISSDTIFACTNTGLYRLAIGSKEWHKIGHGWSFGDMIAITFATNSSNTLFAATEKDIIKLDQEGIWKPLSISSLSPPKAFRITGIISSPFNSDTLIVGTDQGVYIVPIQNDSLYWAVAPEKGTPVELKNFCTRLDYKGQVSILAASRYQGFFYCPDGLFWWPMNSNLKKKKDVYPDFINLTLANDQRAKSCYATTNKGEVERFRFSGPRVALLPLATINVSRWEVKQVSERLIQVLSAPKFVDLSVVDIGVESILKLKDLLANNDTLALYDKVLWCKITNSETSDSMEASKNRSIKLELYACANRAGQVTDQRYFGEKDSESFYPHIVDSLGATIKVREFGINESSCFQQYFWKGWRKYFWSVAIVSMALYPEITKGWEKKSLPAPPAFP